LVASCLPLLTCGSGPARRAPARDHTLLIGSVRWGPGRANGMAPGVHFLGSEHASCGTTCRTPNRSRCLARP
jgi:hypothetical protein